MISLLNNNSILSIIVVVVASLGGIFLLIFGILQMRRTSEIVDQRMQIFIANREKKSPLSNIIYRFTPRELSGSFFNRTIKPFFQKIINYFGKFTPSNSIAKTDFDLRAAGNPYGMHAREFYGIRVIFLFVGSGMAFFIYYYTGSSASWLIGLVAGTIILTLFGPSLWLNSKIRQRKEELGFNLPDVLDMLSVCASAGLSFDQGIKKICEFWPTALSEEFKQMLQEMDMGTPRAEALRNLRTRVNFDELSSFVAIMIQSDLTGMSYADVLQSQARQMRIFRQFRAKERANALPAKMIIPVIIFIFPAILAVIAAPLLPTYFNIFQ
jgi:tight adherence protein C